MNKILLFLSMITLIGFISCEKNDTEAPGKIQGMGNTDGSLQVNESFEFPEGIYLIGDISGLPKSGTKADELKPVNDSKSIYSCYGSGSAVRLKLTLLNSKDYPRTVFFPKGLVWQCQTGNFQHALQCQTTWVCLQANSSRTIVLDLYCVNLSIPAPDQTGTYNILGITTSKIMWSFLNLIKWRKINYEMIYGSSSRKGTETFPAYEEITDRLQTIVHNLTDRGIDISADDIAFIENIPEIAPEEIPVIDDNSQFPEYFEEYVVTGK